MLTRSIINNRKEEKIFTAHDIVHTLGIFLLLIIRQTIK